MAIVDDQVATGQTPQTPPRRPNRALALLRNSWRQLTSMRTALILLFLLAVAAIPGSVLPQRGVNPEDVNDYFDAHPDLAPVLDRIGAFEAFGSVWFSAIYVLLFTSLIGCIVPRVRDHVRALRTPPPRAPRRLDRLPQHAVLPAGAADVARIATELRRRRWRVVVRDDEISAEKGYLKETGNVLFHVSLIAVLVGVALGSWFGWSGNRLLVAGEENAFCNTRQQYAEAKIGPRVASGDLPGFCMRLDDFEARFLETGQPEFFNASVTVDEDGGTPRREEFSVNSPLRLTDANVYLLGHGYAPVIRYTDRTGRSQTSTVPFLTTDATLTSEGVAAFPDVNVDPSTGERDPDSQVAFEGLYLPTAPDAPPYVRSAYPTERSPAVFLVAYRGNLGLDAGIPGSIYQLDQRQVRTGRLTQLGDAKLLRPGGTWTLDDGTSVEFVGTRPYITLSVRHDPGSQLLLFSCGVLLLGLMGSLFGRRRRVFFRLRPAADGDPPRSPVGDATDPTGGSPTNGSSLVEAGGLPRTDYPGFADEFAQLIAALGDRRTGSRPGPARDNVDRDGTREGTE